MQSYPQHTSINMPSYGQDVTTTIPISPQPPPKDFVLWSLFNFVLCNAFCLGLCALSYSIKSRDRIIAKDFVGASSYGRTAKIFNIFAFCVGLLVTILSIVLVFLYLPLYTVRP
ncbi:interferon-induced transmembrane protein 1 [Gallus gallus]|uniref:Interferon-induced transmembrane protein 3 n=1 Tax=Gallus gallus TaxID=9031 RepID=F1NZH7_CHICK|nr:interferon-induced transmembrane protein 1 [Gallus gallus]AGS13736.1 interferon-induced transmembrane protein 3 [Gallus gallus]AQX83310.1 interferon-inducible transmembrane protein 1 [Gallus gallus]|eukprot:NP_001336988.1 interferon-induced transmembrane protein 1 [Gallus gallus]